MAPTPRYPSCQEWIQSSFLKRNCAVENAEAIASSHFLRHRQKVHRHRVNIVLVQVNRPQGFLAPTFQLHVSKAGISLRRRVLYERKTPLLFLDPALPGCRIGKQFHEPPKCIACDLCSSGRQPVSLPGGCTRRGAHRLRLSNEFLGGHAGSRSVLAAQETRHRGCAERRNLAKG